MDKYGILHRQKILRAPIIKDFEVYCLTSNILSLNSFKPGAHWLGVLKLFLFRLLYMYACVFVCVSTLRLLINGGVMWTPYD